MSSPVKTERDAGTVERLIHCEFTSQAERDAGTVERLIHCELTSQDREGCGYCGETDTL